MTIPNWLEPEKPDFLTILPSLWFYYAVRRAMLPKSWQNPRDPPSGTFNSCDSWLHILAAWQLFLSPQINQKNENSQQKWCTCFFLSLSKKILPPQLTKQILSLSDFPRHRLGPNGEAHIFLPFEAVDGPGSSTFLCVWYLCVFAMISCGHMAHFSPNNMGGWFFTVKKISHNSWY